MKLSSERIDELLRAEEKLNALEMAGVDNWDGYDDALEAIRKADALRAEIDDMLDDVLSELSSGAYEPSERGAGFAFHKDSEKSARDMLRDYILKKIGPLV